MKVKPEVLTVSLSLGLLLFALSELYSVKKKIILDHWLNISALSMGAPADVWLHCGWSKILLIRKEV